MRPRTRLFRISMAPGGPYRTPVQVGLKSKGLPRRQPEILDLRGFRPQTTPRWSPRLRSDPPGCWRWLKWGKYGPATPALSGHTSPPAGCRRSGFLVFGPEGVLARGACRGRRRGLLPPPSRWPRSAGGGRRSQGEPSRGPPVVPTGAPPGTGSNPNPLAPQPLAGEGTWPRTARAPGPTPRSTKSGISCSGRLPR
jgi:hypothetical protein